jgi:hypothetical protein
MTRRFASYVEFIDSQGEENLKKLMGDLTQN